MNDTQNEEDVFLAAIEVDAPDLRAAYLDAVCKENDQFRQRVEALLQRHVEPEGVLDVPPPGLVATIELPTIDEEPGTVIGPYKLLQQIGEGGMGVVFMAEQTEPIQRPVALKIIKPGMDTRQVIARFEAERQALALMDHPNIAKVLDAGTTETGRPYFVMELVHGVPITQYCDEKHLPLRDRLTLMVSACQAVQHAHQKGVIHRDIKPTNVLVAEYDDQAVPKVIDFGVAKATASKLTERTMFTEFGQMIGTVEYMSPEQAKLNQLDIDTRSDTYSLGVLLYELLTGSTPFGRKRLNEAAFDEMLRIIREEEPQKPSTRLTGSDTLASVAANRHIEPHKLTALVRGELDWIAMKALDKDRNRRYETATEFATDLQRYLDDEPVRACPPSAAYRLRKFARRNRAALILATAAAATLLLLVLGLAISNRTITAERNETVKALTEKEQALALAEAQSTRASKNFWRASVAIRELMAKLAARGNQLAPSLRKQFSDEAIKYYQVLLHESTSDPTLRYETAVGYRSLAIIHASWGDMEQATKCYAQAIAILEDLVTEHPSNQQYRQQLGYALSRYSPRLKQIGRLQESQNVSKRGQEIYEKLLAETPDSFDYTFELADLLKYSIDIYCAAGRLPDAEKAYQRCSELLKRLIDGQTAPDPYPAAHERGFLRAYLGKTQCVWASGLRGAGRLNEAEQMFQKAVRTFDQLTTEEPSVAEHWQLLADSHRQVGLVKIDLKQPGEAERELRRAIEIHHKRAEKFPQDRVNNAEWSAAYIDLARLLIGTGRRQEARPLLARGVEVDPTISAKSEYKKILIDLEDKK